MGAIRHTLPSWEVSTALGPNTFQRWGVQDSLHELIEDPENMCMHVFEQFRKATGKLPKRILFYRDGVSEGESKSIITEELNLIRNACARLDFNPQPTITLIVVTKDHKEVLF
jgi:eukaryotic translation initiation factor 2C